ncbi:MAG: TfoX family protein [Magnetospirillum sp.]|nr:MAG: TfoX family protein [Magnetospirillum sp.]
MSRELADHVCDMLFPLGPVTARGMFGGFGIYLDGLMFALIAGEVLYLKVDAASKGPFEAAGMGPFKPWEHKPMVMPYWEIPPEVMDDADQLCAWGRAAFDAALRSRKPKAPKPSKNH